MHKVWIKIRTQPEKFCKSKPEPGLNPARTRPEPDPIPALERLPERFLTTKRPRNLGWTIQTIAHTKKISQTQGNWTKMQHSNSRLSQFVDMSVIRKLVKKKKKLKQYSANTIKSQRRYYNA